MASIDTDRLDRGSATYFIEASRSRVAGDALATNLRPAASDANPAGSLAVDWMRMTPYATPETSPRASSTPDPRSPGQACPMSPTPRPGPRSGCRSGAATRRHLMGPGRRSWRSKRAAPSAAIRGISSTRRRLTTTAPDQTASLNDVTFGYKSEADDAPTIAARTPAPSATNVEVGSNVTVTFSEPMNAATFTPDNVQAPPAGRGTGRGREHLVPRRRSLRSTHRPTSRPGRPTSRRLALRSRTPRATRSGDSTWSFTTAVALSSLSDTTAAEFGAGTLDAGTYVSQTTGGEVILKPTAGSEFSGTSLPSGWTSTAGAPAGPRPWRRAPHRRRSARQPERRAGVRARPLDRFVATFGAASFQTSGSATAGRGDRTMGPVRDGRSSTNLFARTNTGNDPVDVSLGTTHRLSASLPDRLAASQIVFSVDGVVVDTAKRRGQRQCDRSSATSPSAARRFRRLAAHDAVRGARTFTSRVLDAHSAVTWAALDWTAATPAGTSVAMSYRTGNTFVPDGSWTSFAPVAASGGASDWDVALHPVPGRPVDDRSEPDADALERLGVLRGRGARHDAAVGDRPDAGLGRDQRARRDQRHGDVQRADRLRRRSRPRQSGCARKAPEPTFRRPSPTTPRPRP